MPNSVKFRARARQRTIASAAARSIWGMRSARIYPLGVTRPAFSIASSANLIAEARSRNISRTLLAGFSDSVDANEIHGHQFALPRHSQWRASMWGFGALAL